MDILSRCPLEFIGVRSVTRNKLMQDSSDALLIAADET